MPSDEEVEGPSIREAITGAMALEESETIETKGAPEESPPPSPSGGEAESAEKSREAPPSPDKPRDEKTGQFAKVKAKPPVVVKKGQVAKAGAVQEPPEGAAAVPPAQQPAVPLAVPAGPRPRSWTAKELESWAKVPAEAQAAILRTENAQFRGWEEIRNINHEHRQFKAVIDPYAQYFKAEGVEPLQAMNYLLSTAVAMRTAPARHKADLLAGWIYHFGVEPQMVADSLTKLFQGGGGPFEGGNGAAGAGYALDPRAIAAQVKNELISSFREVQEKQDAETTAAEFDAALPKMEFIDHPLADGSGTVNDAMEIYLRMMGERNKSVTYEQAYDYVCKLDSGISQILSQRAEADAQAKAKAAEAASAKAAAEASSSLRVSRGTSEEESGGDSIRADLLRSFAKHGSPV